MRLAGLILLARAVICWLPTVDISNSSADTINAISTNKTIAVLKYVDLNQCLCNDRRNVCDLRCCCDASCSSDLIKSWRNAGQCRSEFVSSLNSFLCDETLIALTPKLRELNSSREFVTQLNPSEAYFVSNTITQLT